MGRMKSTLEQLIQQAVQELFGVSGVVCTVEHTELAHGDFATNAALVVAKQVGKNPKEVAEAIVGKLTENKPDAIATISVAGPGFINFTLATNYFSDVIKNAADEAWGKNELFKGKKILVEHSSPNLFKPFHIGHVMNNTIGESIVRLAKYSGAEVVSMSFPSDISLGVAKAIYVIIKEQLIQGQIFFPKSIILLGDAYVKGVKLYDEDESVHPRIKEIADNLYAQKPSLELDIFNICKKFNMDYFESITKNLGSCFDSYIYESEAGVEGKKIVFENIPGVFSEGEGGAIVYTPDGNKLHTSVFINGQGNPTYEAKDLGLIDLKFKKYNPDVSIFITDSQQISHFSVVLDAAKKISTVWAERVEKSLHRYHGRMSFNGQKMSSRLGGVPLAEDIVGMVADEVKKRLVLRSASSSLDKQLEQHRDTEHVKDLTEKISIAAIKFAILRTKAGLNINFDPDTSLSFEGDSGPYLQYTAVRAGSILSKAHELGLEPAFGQSAEVTDVERIIARFSDVVAHATGEWAPHHIVTYLLELAQTFNSWYGNTKIIDAEDPETNHRLAIVQSTQRTITNGLWLLGISVPDKM